MRLVVWAQTWNGLDWHRRGTGRIEKSQRDDAHNDNTVNAHHNDGDLNAAKDTDDDGADDADKGYNNDADDDGATDKDDNGRQ